jgi:hypothetical protein
VVLSLSAAGRQGVRCVVERPEVVLLRLRGEKAKPRRASRQTNQLTYATHGLFVQDVTGTVLVQFARSSIDDRVHEAGSLPRSILSEEDVQPRLKLLAPTGEQTLCGGLPWCYHSSLVARQSLWVFRGAW